MSDKQIAAIVRQKMIDVKHIKRDFLSLITRFEEDNISTNVASYDYISITYYPRKDIIQYAVGHECGITMFGDNPAPIEGYLTATDLLKLDWADEEEPKNGGFVYFLKADNGLTKIGKTKTLNKRIERLGTKLPYELVLEHVIESPDHTTTESRYHDFYKEKRVRGEWFALTDDDLNWIRWANNDFLDDEG